MQVLNNFNKCHFCLDKLLKFKEYHLQKCKIARMLESEIGTVLIFTVN